MQGIVNFSSQLGLAFAILLQPACYLGALALFIFAGWGFWRQAQPDNPYRGRPWVPTVSLFVCGVLASFPTILTKANVSAGSTVVVRMSDAVSYTPTAPTGGLLGANPGQTIVNVVELFREFFQAFGAMACLVAVFAWWASVTGRSNRSRAGCGVQFAFGIALINIRTIAQWLVTTFTA